MDYHVAKKDYLAWLPQPLYVHHLALAFLCMSYVCISLCSVSTHLLINSIYIYIPVIFFFLKHVQHFLLHMSDSMYG